MAVMDSRGAFGPVRRSPFIAKCLQEWSMCLLCILSSMIYSLYSTGRSLQRSPKASGLTFSVILLLHLSAEFDTVATLCFVKYFLSLSLGNIILFLPSVPYTLIPSFFLWLYVLFSPRYYAHYQVY